MRVDECLIFSAGLGTRMGEIGKVLPKPAWPLFETTLLGAQIEFALALGCQRIFVNTHHLRDKMENHLPARYRPYVTFVFEREILGSGGGIHNIVLKNLLKTDTLLTLNSDTFLFAPKPEAFQKYFSYISEVRCLLMGANVTGVGYRKMVIENERLMGIEEAPPTGSYVTYAGMGLINLKGLAAREGDSRFFESVADFRNETVRVVSPPDVEFWDFGTKEYYKKNIYKLIETIHNGGSSHLGNFLMGKGLLDGKKVGEASYNASQTGRVNFTSRGETDRENGIGIELGERVVYV